jgi:dihydroorotate dehydrogenase electron transfer subunit
MKDILFAVEHISFLNSHIFELSMHAQEPLPMLHCGQFIHLKIADNAHALRRPFCLYKYGNQRISVVINIVGKGTEQFSMLKKNDTIKGIVPLGNGFHIDDTHQNVALVGGGIGCAPLLSVPQHYPTRNYRAYLGFSSSSNNIFAHEFSAIMPTQISTDDGSEGYAGYVSQLLKNDMMNFRPDVILTCGPMSMLKSIALLTAEYGIPAFASLEQRMGCGVGACLVCVCAMNDGIHYQRVCADGPVFDMKNIKW